MFGEEKSEPKGEVGFQLRITFQRLYLVFSNEIDKAIQLY